MVYLCEYQYVKQFLDTVLGKTVKVGSSLLRSAASPDFDVNNGSTPEKHPSWDNLYAASAEVLAEGVANNNAQGIPIWDKARVTMMFRPVDYNIISDSDYGSPGSESGRFTSKQPEGSAEFQTTQGLFKFVTDPEHRPLTIQPGFVLPAQRYTYVWHKIPVKVIRGNWVPGAIPNQATITSLQGKINSVTFDGGFYPGTVLFSSYSAKLVLPQVASQNSQYWDISYVFAVRDYSLSPIPQVTGEHIGFNYAFNPLNPAGSGGPIWDLYSTKGTNPTVDATSFPQYQYGDLNQLFQVTW